QSLRRAIRGVSRRASTRWSGPRVASPPPRTAGHSTAEAGAGAERRRARSAAPMAPETTMREGSLEAPPRHPLDWQNPDFYDMEKIDAEMRRIFDICHGCRRCFNLCDSFPRLFDLIDESP